MTAATFSLPEIMVAACVALDVPVFDRKGALKHDRGVVGSGEQDVVLLGATGTGKSATTRSGMASPPYLVTAKMKDGNLSRIIVWVADTVIVKKQLDQKALYYLADAVSGKPVEKAKWAVVDREAAVVVERHACQHEVARRGQAEDCLDGSRRRCVIDGCAELQALSRP